MIPRTYSFREVVSPIRDKVQFRIISIGNAVDKSPSRTLPLRNLTTVKSHVFGANTNFPGFRVYGCLRTTNFFFFLVKKKNLSTGSHFYQNFCNCHQTSKMLSRSYGGLQHLVRRQSYLANMTNSSFFN